MMDIAYKGFDAGKEKVSNRASRDSSSSPSAKTTATTTRCPPNRVMRLRQPALPRSAHQGRSRPLLHRAGRWPLRQGRREAVLHAATSRTAWSRSMNWPSTWRRKSPTAPAKSARPTRKRNSLPYLIGPGEQPVLDHAERGRDRRKSPKRIDAIDALAKAGKLTEDDGKEAAGAPLPHAEAEVVSRTLRKAVPGACRRQDHRGPGLLATRKTLQGGTEAPRGGRR